MKTPADIIKDHLNGLINRLVARNPLLHFKPSDRGHRMDVCDLFAAQSALSADNGDKSAEDVFRELISGWTKQKRVEIKLPEKSAGLTGKLMRMQRTAKELRDASGMHALFWAWPFAHIPRKNDKPLVAPLLFWRIDTQLSNGRFSVRLLDGAPYYNFILDAWLKHKRRQFLDFASLVGDDADDWNDNAVAQRIGQLAAEWEGCHNATDANNLYQLRKFSTDGEQLAILPCAAIGVAYFKYWSVIKNLNQLIENAQGGEILLPEFFHAADEILWPTKAKSPGESEKYLVEQSDAAQERAVWQARQSKVMLLKGPPGTGKSQTIVNLIADSLRKGKRVALVCHKLAALEVVEKRLADRNLGDLAAKIVSPIEQRSKIIRTIRDIKDGKGAPSPESNDSERKRLAAQISKIEKNCDGIAESRGRDNLGHSMRGDFLGRMEKAREKADFSPFDPAHEQFVQDVRPHLPENKDALSRGKKELEDFVEDYATCRFASNRWQSCRCHPNEGASIAMRFKAIVQRAAALDGKRGHLPAAALSSLLFNSMMRNHAQWLFSGAKKEVAALLANLIRYTKDIFAEAKLATAPPIWKDIFQGQGGEIYRRYAEDAEHLGMVASINERLQADKLTTALNHHYGDAMQHWSMILDAVFCYFEFGKLPEHSTARHRQYCDSLKEQINLKRHADVAAVLRAFPRRYHAAQTLSTTGLLRLRRHGNTPASTIRGICHADWENFSRAFPVLLLNPDSMCQILPLEAGILDLAIVDEASQMFVADALPILYRAKNIVVSGDNMQMPPDDTFALQNSDEEDTAEEKYDTFQPSTKAAYTEEPALLDAVEGWIPADSAACCALNVHYRSRPEELIAFSNHAFYDGKLQASPNNIALPPPLSRPIEIHHVAGTFQDRVNETEARAIIELLKRVWSVDEPPSVGVIVFNVKQEKHLKDMIEDERKHCSDFSEAHQRAVSQTADAEDASFFVRSVENVQGDERDIIILGTTYNNAGSYGLLSHSEKGRRRLNVAITRAKYGMYVVSSLDINSISNEGERPGSDNKGSERWYLWKFMQYAAAVSNGNREAAVGVLRLLNQRYAPHETGREPDSQFEIDVAEFLRAEGYEVGYQIGESGFRIDLGVKRRGDSRYLCGIECDGRFWHDGWHARHADIWRQGILEDKGWNIYRIWSDAWYSTSNTAKKDLLAHLEKLADDAD